MYRERPLLGFALFKSGGEKRLARFSFIRAEAFIPHPFECNKRYESRLQFLMRTQSAAFTACFVIGHARKILRGELRAPRSLQVAHCSDLLALARLDAIIYTGAYDVSCKGRRAFSQRFQYRRI